MHPSDGTYPARTPPHARHMRLLLRLGVLLSAVLVVSPIFLVREGHRAGGKVPVLLHGRGHAFAHARRARRSLQLRGGGIELMLGNEANYVEVLLHASLSLTRCLVLSVCR